jgi:probable addiction module antidote protein
MIKDNDFRKYHIDKLKDQEEARIYLEVALEEYEEDHDTQAFLKALKDVTVAQGGITNLAKKSSLSRQNLYKVMSGEKKPRLETISHIIHSLGFKFTLKPIAY